jgi:hypothetical protein
MGAINRVFNVCLLAGATLCSASTVQAQVYPHLSSVQIVGTPMANEPVASIWLSGMLDWNSQGTHANFLKRDGSKLLFDVLIYEKKTPVEPPSPLMFTGGDGFVLPAGRYSLTVRTFLDHREAFPVPWTFPDSYSTEFGRGPTSSLALSFNVYPIPEPSALYPSLLAMTATAMACRRASRQR